MKYAILGPQGRINRISDDEPQNVGEGSTVVEITDEQAATVQAGMESTPRIPYFLHEDELETQAECMARRAEVRKAEREAARIAAMTPEQLQVKAAWDASAAAFESLPLGKQALWETVRVKVADFIQAGDFASAAATIQSVPTLYEGMDDDRNAFLQLFG
jgi:hypothetical protein